MNKDLTNILLEDMKRLYSIRNDVKIASDEEDTFSTKDISEALKEVQQGIETMADKLKEIIFKHGEFYRRD